MRLMLWPWLDSRPKRHAHSKQQAIAANQQQWPRPSYTLGWGGRKHKTVIMLSYYRFVFSLLRWQQGGRRYSAHTEEAPL